MATPREDLIDRLANRPENVLIVVGSGVSAASTGNNPIASWKGLLEHGIDYCVDYAHATREWADLRRAQLKVYEYIQVATEISTCLNAPKSGLFARWLETTVGTLNVTVPRLIQALGTWGSLIATTNYDTCIAEVTKLKTWTWLDKAWLAQFTEGNSKHVLHLHGVHDRPASVVLGAKSYEDVVRDPTIQGLMRALVFTKTFVFVGCGLDGLSDPNFSSLMHWYKEVLAETIRPSYLIVREHDKAGWKKEIQGSQILILSYGENHSDLPAYIEKIAEEVSRKRSPDVGPDLVSSQLTFDQQTQQVLSQKDTMGPGESMRQLMALAKAHWRAGGRRSAWMSVYGKLQEEGKALQAEERVRFALELASMAFDDGMPDMALDSLDDVLPDVQSDEVGFYRRHEYWKLKSCCLQALGPYTNTRNALDRALASAPTEGTRLTLEAELAEVLFLQGEDGETPKNPTEVAKL